MPSTHFVTENCFSKFTIISFLGTQSIQYGIQTCFIVHKSLKWEVMRKNVKQWERINISSLKCYCVFQVIIVEK